MTNLNSYNPIDIPDWGQGIIRESKSNIFHHPAWLNVIQQTYKYPFQLVKIDVGNHETILPFLEVKNFLGRRRWICLPFTDYYLPLSIDNAYLEMVAAYLFDQIKIKGVSSAEIRWDFPSSFTSYHTDNVLHLLNIEPNLSLMEKNIDASHKRNIRHALKSNLRIEISRDSLATKRFYNLHVLTRKKLGVPVQPWKFFRNIQSVLLDNNFGYYILIYQQEKCIAGALFMKWQKTLTYKFGASDPSMLTLRPNNLIFIEAIRLASEEGYEIFDFGKTELSNQGLRRFKSGWGANESMLPYSYIVNREEYKTPQTGNMMDLLRKFIKISPDWMGRILGEIFYKYFP